MCPQERLVIISKTTGLSFALKRIGPLAAIIIPVFYLLVLYLFAISNTPENLFASVYSESLIKTTYQYLLLLVGFDTLIYRKYCDTPPILVGHHSTSYDMLDSNLFGYAQCVKQRFIFRHVIGCGEVYLEDVVQLFSCWRLQGNTSS